MLLRLPLREAAATLTACKVGPGDSRAGRNPMQKSSLPSGTGWLSQQYSLQVLVTGACLQCQGEGKGRLTTQAGPRACGHLQALLAPPRPGHSLWALPPRAGPPAPDGEALLLYLGHPRPHPAGPNTGAGDKTAQVSEGPYWPPDQRTHFVTKEISQFLPRPF